MIQQHLHMYITAVSMHDRHSNFYAYHHRDFNTKAYRKAAYGQVIMYHHGYLGQGNWKVAPSCAVWDHYPAPDGIYMGFMEH